MMQRYFPELLVTLLLVSPALATEKTAAPVEPLTFEKQVRPILKAYCFECHGEGKKLRGGLDLRLTRLAVEGGDSGSAIVPGHGDKSLLLQRIKKKEMPPGKVKLTGKEIDLIERWLAEGARTAAPEPKQLGKGIYITPEERAFWSFQPVQRPAVPSVKSQKLVRNPIDAFLLEKLEQKGLSFAPEAERETLLRRAYFDLIGLPPTPKEVAEFLADQSPDAYEKLIDRLLASPHYGERWGRHWLDAAGYADSEGYSNEDPSRPYVYKYRDYVIKSFNMDRPFDQFILEQLAGDELVPQPYKDLDPDQLDKLIATGFLRMAPDGTASKGMDNAENRNQVIADTLEIVSTSLLGLTVNCAQCHNHKYDPISQEDYYTMRAIFEPALDWKNWRVPAARNVAFLSDEDQKKATAIEKEAAQIDQVRLKKQEEFINSTFDKQLAKIPEDKQDAARAAWKTVPAKRSAEQKKLMQTYPNLNVSAGSLYLYDKKAADELKSLADEAAKLRAGKPVPDYVHALTEQPGKVPTTFLFTRGEYQQPDHPVQPGGLTILESLKLGTIPGNDPALPTTGRRLAFAKQLTSGKHPLVPRVLVNRAWLQHFGRGIVNTPGDFGLLGDPPTHPELLDWLADEFMKNGWSMKKLHKLIMTSSAYRQSSQPSPALQKIDPDNLLFGRMPLRRLEAEIIRDAILSVSGKLNGKQFGPAVPVTVDEFGQVVLGVDTRDGAGRFTGKKVPLGDEEFRRSVYVQVRRTMPLGVLETFDAPEMSPNCLSRNFSTVSPQALMLMNSKFIHDQAQSFAERLEKEAGTDTRAQVKLAWLLAFAREPSAKDIDDAVTFLQTQAATFAKQKNTTPDQARQKALANFCQALISSNPFLYVD